MTHNERVLVEVIAHLTDTLIEELNDGVLQEQAEDLNRAATDALNSNKLADMLKYKLHQRFFRVLEA